MAGPGAQPAATPSWGIVATVRAPLTEVLAFAAHHLALGPERIWLFFDDPEDPAAEHLAGIAGVTVVRCDSAHWKMTLGKRPDTHQVRQTMNVRRVHGETGLQWILHIDVDEFLIADRPLAPILAAAADRATVRVEPWDALCEPDDAGNGGGVFVARHFRRGLRPGEDPALLREFYGAHAELLPKGVLGHSAGKCFFRTGIEDFKPSIHTARFLGRAHDAGAFEPGLALLHFHAEDRARWLARLAFRAEHGAYRSMPRLQAFLRTAAPEAIADFYDRVQVASPQLLKALAARGFTRRHDLELEAMVAALTVRQAAMADPAGD